MYVAQGRGCCRALDDFFYCIQGLMGFSYLNQIVGEKLSAVVFVMDYHQLQFDGPGFTILNPITVTSGRSSVSTGDDRFRNRLCEQIAKVVKRATCAEGDSSTIEFEDDSTKSISLKAEDYTGPEAIILTGNDNVWDVI